MERDLDSELQLHYDREVAKLVARGLPAAEAQRQARLAIGGTEQLKEDSRDAWGIRWLESGLRDGRYALRTLRKHPAVALCALLILTISSGASTAVFSVLDATVFEPLPVANADRLLRLQIVSDRAQTVATYPSYTAFEQLRHAQSMKQLAAESTPISVADAAQVRQRADAPTATGLRVRCATGNYFDVLGLGAHVGRTLQTSDDDASADHQVAVATYRFWKDRYALDPRALGSTLQIRSTPFTIVGFLPEGFEGTRKGALVDVYVPMASMPDACGRSVQPIGVLARGTSRSAASAEFTLLWNRLKTDPQFAIGAIAGQLLVSSASRGVASVDDDQETSLYLLAFGVGLVLLIGCLNASCLLVVQGVARRNEIAIRRALGATGAAILRQSFIESGLLAATGGLCGIALATLGEKAILTWLHWGGRPIDLSVDGRVLGFSLAVVLIAGVVSGLLPALDAMRTQHLEIYRDEQLRPFRSGKALIILEVALSLMLVAGAGMFLRSVSKLRSIPLGFNARDIVLVTLWPNYQDFPEDVDNERYLTAQAARLRTRLAQMPGMDRATVGTGRTFSRRFTYDVSRADGPSGEAVTADAAHVDDRYFDVLQIPLLFGRAFADWDNDSSERVVIVNRSLAGRLFGPASPLGREVALGATTAKVVGVAGDIHRRSLKDPPVSMIYLPLWQRPVGRGWTAETNVQVRTHQSPIDVQRAIEAEIAAGRYALQLSSLDDSRTLESDIEASYADDTVRMHAMSLLAGVSLVLVLAGIYGLTTYVVARRSREIGVRMAIGATPNQILGLILKECVMLVGIGVLLGIPGTLVVMRAVSNYTFHVTPLDPSTIAGAVAVMLLTAGAAAARPLWRSTRVDPVETLRAN